MDKKGAIITMKKAGVLFCVLFSFIILLNGCETTKGVAQGVSCTVEGAAKDAQGLWAAILKVDKWMKENLW